MTEPGFAHGGPPLSGMMRVTAEDFEVDEKLGFDPEGRGEHVFVRIEKCDANTEWVARSLGAALHVAPVAIGFSGLKDRHALTRQTFSIHLPGTEDPDWNALGIEGVRVLAAVRHPRKLKRGTHKRNHFRIHLRDVEGDRAATERVLASICAAGVPNYFGDQRFGRDGENLRLAQRHFNGARLGRSERSFALSAARSFLFNRVLAERVAGSSWNTALDGDVWMLAGTHSIFGPQSADVDIERRIAEGDIDPTGPLWGRGELRSAGVVRDLELSAAAAHGELARGLESADLTQQRRSLRLRADALRYDWLPDRSLRLEFSLPSGTFATVLIRELCALR